MSGSARIDDLERKFGENPGRYFVPLANEYRKAGQLERAVEICQEQLSAQPNHLSGHVVLGKALFARGDRPAATQAFESALRVDPENLDALHQLALLARDEGKGTIALDFARRALAVDPLDPELLAIASDLSAPPEEDVAPPSFDPRQMFEEYAPQRAAPDHQNPMSRPRAVDELLREAPTGSATPESAPEAASADNSAPESPPTDSAEAETPPSSPLTDTSADMADQTANMALSGGEVSTDPAAERAGGDTVSPWDDVPPDEIPDAAADLISAWPAVPNAEPEPEPERVMAQESEPEPEPERFAAPEPEPVAASEPVGAGYPESEPESDSAPAAGRSAVERAARLTPAEEWPDLDWPEEPQPQQLADVRTPVGSGDSVIDDARPDAGGDEVQQDPPLARLPEEAEVAAESRVTFVTETMAELLVKQGRRHEAARVYRQLLEQNPGDSGIQARLDDLFAAAPVTAADDVRPRPSPVPSPAPIPPDAQVSSVTDAIAAAEAFGTTDEEAPGPPASPPMRELLTRILAYTPPVGSEPVTSAFLTESRDSSPPRSLPGGLEDAVASAELAARNLADAGAALADPGAAASLERAIAAQPESIGEVLSQAAPMEPMSRQSVTSGAARQAPSFSFDQFFRDVMPEGEGDTAEQKSPPPGEVSRAAEIDDTDDFRAWLDGLRKS